MFSPFRAIASGAFVLAIGGALVIAQPFVQQDGVRGAETEAIAPTWVTGSIGLASEPCTGPDSEQDGSVRRDRDFVCSPQRWTASDPRLDGTTVASVWNDDVHQTDDGVATVTVVAAYLRNDQGGWACSGSNLYEGEREESTTGRADILTCIGQDEYEGLSAVLAVDGPALAFEGLIFSGDLPPVPDAPADG